MAFYVNDWFGLGHTEDLLRVWDVPLITWDLLAKSNGNKYAAADDNFISEQYIWIQFLKKSEYYQNLPSNKMEPLNRKALKLSEESLAGNTVLCTADLLGFDSLKYPNKIYATSDNHYKYYLYTHSDWKKLYNRYCDGDLEKDSQYYHDKRMRLRYILFGYLGILLVGLHRRAPLLYRILREIYRKLTGR